jgi:hypothetical protein
MPEGVIDMGDMGAIFSVTDLMGIHRESVSVELAKEDPGSISRNARGVIEITVPASGAIQEFAGRLQAELEALGYVPIGPDENGDEDG